MKPGSVMTAIAAMGLLAPSAMATVRPASANVAFAGTAAPKIVFPVSARRGAPVKQGSSGLAAAAIGLIGVGVAGGAAGIAVAASGGHSVSP